MPDIRLKSLLKKKKSTAGMLEKLSSNLGVPFSIQDQEGNWVWGAPQKQYKRKFPIQQGANILGWVIGSEDAAPMADLIAHLANKELEKKEIGAEVLDLYREINLIYKFSEKLADALDPTIIAETALEEVSQLIKGICGTVILLPEKSGTPYILASIGAPFFSSNDLIEENFLRDILLDGQAGIHNGFNKALGKGQAKIASLIYAPLKVKHRLLGLILLANENPVEYKAAHLKLLTTLALQSASAIESTLLFQKRIQEAEEREEAIRQIHEVTTRFVPHEFISSLGREKLTEVIPGDAVLREVSVFFSDIRGYTSLAESMSPEDTFRFVLAYNRRVGPVIYANEGFVNQYLGDGIMAIFPQKPSDALRAAINMQKVIQQYNLERIAVNRQPIKVGMGIHTGQLIMGIIGDARRMEAATISDTVNTAARIESLTKYYGANILVSGDSLGKIKTASFNLRYLGLVQVKGKEEPLAIYECFDGDIPEQIEKKSATATLFSEAIQDYYNRNFSATAKALKQILSINPKDLAAQILYKRTETYLQKAIPEDWTGIEKMNIK